MNPHSTAVLAALLLAASPLAFAAEHPDLSKLDLSKLPPASTKKGLTYAKDIRPLLETSCFRCHGQDRPKAGLRLDSRETLLEGGDHGKVVVPGKSKESLLLIAASQIDPEIAMPPKRGARGPCGPGRPAGTGGPGGPGSPGGHS